LKESALDAEEEFLEAMKQVRKEFRVSKEKLGSEGAVDLFMDKIRNEQENEENGSKSTGDELDSSNDEHSPGA